MSRDITPLERWLLGGGTIFAFLLLWETVVRIGAVDSKILPPASVVLGRYMNELANPAFYVDLRATLLRVAGGLGLAVVIAVPLGLLIGYWSLLFRMLGLTIEVLRPIPAIALLPVVSVIFGLGSGTNIALIFIATSIPILTATIDGVRSVDPVLIGTSRTLGRSTRDIFLTVLLPASLPHLSAGLRLSMTIALLVGISVEMLVSAEGLGIRVVMASRLLDMSGLYAGVLLLSTLGFLVNQAYLQAENRVLFWHRQSRNRR